MPPEPPKPPRAGTIHSDRNEDRKSRPRGVPIIPSVLPPPRGEFDFEHSTQVGTDVQVFRAVKALHERLDANEEKAEKAHGELKGEVGKLGDKFDAMAKGHAEIVGFIKGQTTEREIAARTKSPSSMMRFAQGDASITLAGKIVDDQLKGREWFRSTTTKVISAAIGGGGLVAALHKLGIL